MSLISLGMDSGRQQEAHPDGKKVMILKIELEDRPKLSGKS